MLKRLLAFAVSAGVGAILVGASVAGPTQVEHFTDGPFPDEVCGVSGTSIFQGTSVFREGADGTFFAGGTFRGMFTADNGKSITVFAAGPAKQSSPPIIDEEAGTITFVTTVVGLPEKLSITNGPTLSRDAGTVSFVDVFEYTGDPEDPVGDFISTDLVGLHGPHPDLLSEFEVFCDVLEPYLLDPKTNEAREAACSGVSAASLTSDPACWSSELRGSRRASLDRPWPALSASDLDAPRLRLFCDRQLERQYAVLVPCFDLIEIERVTDEKLAAVDALRPLVHDELVPVLDSEAPLSANREHVLLAGHLDRVRIDAGQIEMHEEAIPTTVSIHREAARAPSPTAHTHLLAQAVELREWIEP